MGGEEELAQKLRSHEIIPTRARLILAKILLAKHQHFTAEELYRQLQMQGYKISRASVYNNLHLFVRVGLLRTLHINPSLTIYDSNTEPHNHLIDIDTGEIFDIDIRKPMPEKGRPYYHEGSSYYIEQEQAIFYGRKHT
ncbi:MAG: transcriptional repressor [Leptospiraceae bacterium]|nr:transcriptional repressor [Leptospiraceae bacterium]MDW8307083.1 Fur family transcriptional regulator [Leptospiraceae bacterium]